MPLKMKTFKDALNCMKWQEIRLTILFAIFWSEQDFAHQWKNYTFKKWWNETGKWLYIATLGPIWKISSSAENLASLSLQDGATKWLYFLAEPPTHPSIHPPDQIDYFLYPYFNPFK